MRFSKSFSKLLSLLWILLLYQISVTSCASLRNYSLKSINFTVINSDLNAPKNLSELIEFSPLNLPVELENITIMHQEMKEQTAPKIITLKLKTHVIVHNQGQNNQSIHQENGEIKVITPNVTESSLSDIEYLDSSDDFEFWKWKSNARSKRMNLFDEQPTDEENNDTEINDSSVKSSTKIMETIYESEDSQENHISKQVHRSVYATGRQLYGKQFVFHPYLPYGKDTSPDEKITFDDILPVKMVKFIKSMVEEAPWEQMFMKMVRMIVDQFVDKIIEKMFADKGDHHLKRRSFEVFITPTFVLPTFETPVVRQKRAVDSNTSSDQDEDLLSFLPPKRKEQDTAVEGKKSADERKSWLDHFLDFVFPNSEANSSDEESSDRLKKRDTTNSHLLKKLVTFFLNTFEKSSGFIADAKDALRYKMLKEFLPYLFQKKYLNNNSVDGMKMSHRNIPDSILKRNDVSDNFPGALSRSKRSTRGHFRKDDENRLWQAHSRRHRPPNQRSHDECSLRKACNAGRLLSRLPSVQEITLQLRSNGNEPHWDALIWGMKKKRCSRIFCKRQRSPKGSLYPWNTEKSRLAKKDELVTEPPDPENDQSNNLTI